MRSVVVVLPASMCAMIPMLRVLASWASLLAITSPLRFGPCSGAGDRPVHPWAAGASGRASPAVVRECLVRLGHLVGVLAALDRGTQTVAGVEQLVHEALGHRLLPAGSAFLDQPVQVPGGGGRCGRLVPAPEGGTPRGGGADPGAPG